jgi:hypothetical protein
MRKRLPVLISGPRLLHNLSCKSVKLRNLQEVLYRPPSKGSCNYYIVNHIQNLNVIAISFTKDDRIFMKTEINQCSNEFIAGQNLRIKI